MPGQLDSLRQHYTTALEEYLKKPDEDGLRAAAELGQRILAGELGILEALTLHEGALEALRTAEIPNAGSTIATVFLRGVLASFDRKLRDSDRREAALQQQVQAVSQELESFRYSVSHDLRAPLRAIEGFSAILAEEHAQQLGEEGGHYLEIVRSSAGRLGLLIEDLLLLVRVGRSPLSPQSVNVSEMAKDVAAGLQRNQPERKVEFQIEAGIVAEADANLLRIVLENLLGNAWKFTAKTAAPRIELGVMNRPDGAALFVRDNGVGFDMQYAGKLFTPFQRLHSESDFPGAGVGLAVVRRIVERHGGRVWIEGAIDRGATVFFTLPPADGRSAEMT